jgi:hypothetical protein
MAADPELVRSCGLCVVRRLSSAASPTPSLNSAGRGGAEPAATLAEPVEAHTRTFLLPRLPRRPTGPLDSTYLDDTKPSEWE